MYGQYKYGEYRYGEEGSSKSDNIRKWYELNLFYQLPPGLYKNLQGTTNMAEIRANETTINRVLNDIDSLEDEVTFVNAKDIGIARKEDMYGIKTNKSRPIEYRKSAVTSKARGVGVITKQAVENMAAAFSNGEVQVIEPEDAHIIIKFIGVRGIPPNMDDLINTLDVMLPAHVLYEFKYTYTTCQMLINWNVTCDEAKTMTCTDLKTYEKGVSNV